MVICTPVYKRKADERLGGVGYEIDIISAEKLALNITGNKFIPILRRGEWKEAAPTFLMARHHIDLHDGIPRCTYEEEYRRLLSVLNDTWEGPPPLGNAPHKSRKVIDEEKLQITLDCLMGRTYKVGRTIKYGNGIWVTEKDVVTIFDWLITCMSQTRDFNWVSILSRKNLDALLADNVWKDEREKYSYNEDERNEIMHMCADRLKLRLYNYAGDKKAEYNIMDNGDAGFRFR